MAGDTDENDRIAVLQRRLQRLKLRVQAVRHGDQSELVALLDEIGPAIVLTHSPVDYMEDHTNTCRLAVTASFARCMPNFPCDGATPAYYDDVTVYHAQPHGNCDPLYGPIVPKLFVDVGSKMETKTAMLAAHRSQKLWLRSLMLTSTVT